MECFAKQQQIPVVQFRKGQRKDNVMKELRQTRRRRIHRQSAGKDARVPHREAPQSGDGLPLLPSRRCLFRRQRSLKGLTVGHVLVPRLIP
jgi:hypothetical protein